MLNDIPKAVLFDWDNTLIDSWLLIHKALENTYRHFGHKQLSLEEVKNNVHKSMKDSFPIIFGDKTAEAEKFYQQSYLNNRFDHFQVLDGAQETLDLLLSKGVIISIVSNKAGIFLRDEVAHLDWNKYFHKVIGSKDAPYDKPHPQPLLMSLEGTNITPGKDLTWFVGDTIADMEAAYNLGSKAILYGPQDDLSRFKPFTPHFHAQAHRNLHKLITSLHY